MVIFGVDIGGTFVKMGLVDNNSEILIADKIPTTYSESNDLIKLIYKQFLIMLKKINLNKNDVYGIGVGCPGIVSSTSGKVVNCRVFNYKQVDLKKMFNDIFNINTIVYNDANLMTIGEYSLINSSNIKNMIFCCFGTGIGGGIIINKKLYLGGQGACGEFGHMIIHSKGIQCSCGRKGCYEQYASLSAFVTKFKSNAILLNNQIILDLCQGNVNNIDASIIFKAYNKGNNKIDLFINNYLFEVCEGLLNIMNLFRPDLIIIGGGFSYAGDLILNKIKNICKNLFFGYHGSPEVQIEFSHLKNDAGLLGAYQLFKQ